MLGDAYNNYNYNNYNYYYTIVELDGHEYGIRRQVNMFRQPHTSR